MYMVSVHSPLGDIFLEAGSSGISDFCFVRRSTFGEQRRSTFKSELSESLTLSFIKPSEFKVAVILPPFA